MVKLALRSDGDDLLQIYCEYVAMEDRDIEAAIADEKPFTD